MKIRNGFVSNSSSSSFIILLPDDFDINTIDIQLEIDKDKYCKCEVEDVKKAFSELVKYKSLYDDEFYKESNIIHKILKPYVVATIEGGPDEGSITLLDNKKIKKILNIS